MTSQFACHFYFAVRKKWRTKVEILQRWLMTNWPEERMFYPISRSLRLRCTTGEPGKVPRNLSMAMLQPPSGGLEMLKRIDRIIETVMGSTEALLKSQLEFLLFGICLRLF